MDRRHPPATPQGAAGGIDGESPATAALLDATRPTRAKPPKAGSAHLHGKGKAEREAHADFVADLRAAILKERQANAELLQLSSRQEQRLSYSSFLRAGVVGVVVVFFSTTGGAASPRFSTITGFSTITFFSTITGFSTMTGR